MVFSPAFGTYTIYTEKGKLTDISTDDVIQLNYHQGEIIIKSLEKDFGKFKSIKFIGKEWQNSFKIKSNQPAGKITFYEDNLFVSSHSYYNYFKLINNININNYVAGVVEAEVGKSPPEEYFKLQAIICRTYALKNISRHQDEGYSLCDRVHCQAYHGKPKSAVIHNAAIDTRGVVIVDYNIDLITATFYSNCGGQSANSEDVWTQNLYYLRSIRDSFCLNENNSIWTKKIPTKNWEKYLHKHCNHEVDFDHECGLEYFQNSREKHLEKQNISIPLTKIRQDFKLKSAYFNVEQNNDFVTFKGRGFGHGVGLCQEGAMRMAKLGYDYAQILHYYYKDVHMINISAIDFFKQDF